MLSQAADSLFWMARYLERAENQARLLDVSLNMAMIDTPEDREAQLAVPLQIAGTRALFDSLYPELTPKNLVQCMVLDPHYPDSTYNLIRKARENAHHVRGNLSADVWESINSAWIEIQEFSQGDVTEANASWLSDWTRERSHLFRGAAYGTLLRNDAFLFLRLGTFIERANNTARTIDVRFALASQPEHEKDARGFFEWTALLHSLAAFEAYQNLYGHNLQPLNVLELLILGRDVPRSLQACMKEIVELLAQIDGPRGRSAKRLANSLHANLSFGDRTYIADRGVQEYLMDFIHRVNRIAHEMHRSYMEGQA